MPTKTSLSALFRPGSRSASTWLSVASLSAIASALVAPGGALAQDAGSLSQEFSGDILVTAQRKSQSIQDVPIAVTAVAAEQINNLNLRTVADIQLVTPGLDFRSSYGYLQSFIRGIGAPFATAGLEPPVAIYLDGSYLPRGGGTGLDLVDVDSIQVLRGPQGSLYGQNATGGAIILETANPTSQLAGAATLEYGNFDRKSIEGYLNVPVSDTMAFRISGKYLDENGYITNLFDGNKVGGREGFLIRGKFAVDLSADIRATVYAERSEIDMDGAAVAQRFPTNLCLGCGPDGSGTGYGFYEVNTSFNEEVNDRATRAGLIIDGEIGRFTFKNTTGYIKISQNNPSDQDYTGAELFDYYNFNGGETFSQEVQLSSNFGGPIDGLLGGTYIHDKGYFSLLAGGGAFAALVAPDGALPGIRNDVTTESYAVFGELTAKPLNRLSVTVGGRYSRNRRSNVGTMNAGGNLGFGGAPGILRYEENKTFSKFTPRIVVGYDLDQVNLYASYNEGFKAGGFNTPSAASRPLVEPEQIKSYEVGAKFVSVDRRIRANLAVFQYDYADVQVSIIDVTTGAVNITNAATARGRGAEFDLNFRPANVLELFGSVAYLDAKYRRYPNAGGAGPSAQPDGGLVSIPPRDLSGFRLPHAPKWTFSLGANLDVAVSSDWKAHVSTIGRYSSAYDFTAGAGGPLGFDHQGKFFVLNASAYLSPLDDRFEVGVYAENLTNEKYSQIRQTSAPFGGSEIVARPRSYGIRLRAKL
jgi:iron complex outermembrane receptor protein